MYPNHETYILVAIGVIYAAIIEVYSRQIRVALSKSDKYALSASVVLFAWLIFETCSQYPLSLFFESCSQRPLALYNVLMFFVFLFGLWSASLVSSIGLIFVFGYLDDVYPWLIWKYSARLIKVSLLVVIVCFSAGWDLINRILIVPKIPKELLQSLAFGWLLWLLKPAAENFLSGLHLAFSRRVNLNDKVATGGISGTIEEIGLVHTTIVTEAGIATIPNSKISSEPIERKTKP